MPPPASPRSAPWLVSEEHVFCSKQNDLLNYLEMPHSFKSSNHRKVDLKCYNLKRLFFHSNIIAKCLWIFTFIISFAHTFLELYNYCCCWGSSPLINWQADTLSQNDGISPVLTYPNLRTIKTLYLQYSRLTIICSISASFRVANFKDAKEQIFLSCPSVIWRGRCTRALTHVALQIKYTYNIKSEQDSLLTHATVSKVKANISQTVYQLSLKDRESKG